MAELAPVHELVKQFARHTEAIDILREIHKRRPAIMVGELLDKLKVSKEPAPREPRSLKNHPIQPLSRR